MTDSPARRRARRLRAFWLLAPAALGVALTYADTVSRGLWWDDYHALRPRTWAEIAGAFHGTWDPAGLWPVFYRPLTIAYYALGFQLFGLNAWALHVVSLVELTAAAWLLAVFVLGETRSPSLAAVAAMLFGVHPAIAHAEGPWFFLQNHLLCTLVVIAALLAWQRRRERSSIGGWWPIWMLTAAGFLIQEDVVMLAPALVGARWLRARVIGDMRPPRRSLVVFAVALAAGLFAVRYACLGELGGRDLPTAPAVAMNAVRLLARVLFVFQRQQLPANLIASVVSSGCLIAGGWLTIARIRKRRGGAPSPDAALGATGVALFVTFALPLLLLSSPSRYHLLALAAVLMLTAATSALWRALQPRAGTIVCAVAVLTGLASLLAAGRTALDPWRPCAPELLGTDADVAGWAPVPLELRQWLARKPAACQAGQYQPLTASLETVTWHPLNADGVAAVALVTRQMDAATVLLRVRAASRETPVTLVLSANGVDVSVLPFTTDAWQSVPVTFPSSVLTHLRGMHRLDVRVIGWPRAGVTPGALSQPAIELVVAHRRPDD
jgi:hypothetical protein